MNAKTSNRRVRCLLCADGRTVTLNNFSTHVRGMHPGTPPSPRKGLFAELDDDRALPVRVASASTPPPLPPLAADDIVTTVVEQLADPSGLMPVAHLAAIFAWRDATTAFFKAVKR